MQYQNANIFQKLTLRQKISIGVSLVSAVILLFFFAFTIFFIALGVGAIIFISRLLSWRGKTRHPRASPSKYPKVYRHDPAKDDDVIDV